MMAIFRHLALILAFIPLTAFLSGCGGHTPSDKIDPSQENTPMEKLVYPAARIQDQVDDYHGTKVSDPYRWLEDVDSDETHAWVEAENAVTFAYLKKIPVRDTYKKRLTEIWNYARYSAPFKEGGLTFYFKNDGLQNQSVLYVLDTPEAEARVLLDPNTLSEDGTVSLADVSISRDGKYMAWSTSVSGSDWRTWYVRNIASGQDLDDEVNWSKFSGAAWDHDGKGFFYSRYAEPADGNTFEEANYNQKLYYHRVGTPQSQDGLIYERTEDPEWGFGGSVSEDGRYLIISVWQGTARTNRLYYKDLLDRSNIVHELLNDFDASYEFLGNKGPVFYIKTNKDAPREKIISIDIQHPQIANWKTIIPESDTPIESVSILNNSLVVSVMNDVASFVQIYDLDGAFLNDIKLPGLGSVGGFSGHQGDSETFYIFNSYLNPSEIYHYDFTTAQSTLYRAPEIDFDFSGYETTRVFYPSRDGTPIPLFLVHKKDLVLDGSNPTILYGYGGFNISLQPRFSTSILPWIENGGVYAVANLRGGGEYGEDWHQGGMLKNKQNVFDDFIAAGEYLIRKKFTSSSRLSVYGGSNGGTLVGAVVNQRPELFAAAIPAVGVMDMLRFQKFTIGWAWTSDYGSSEDAEMFPTLYAYSPYHNLKKGTSYPAIMVMTADHDDRVVPGHSFKYAAMLQTCQAGNEPVLIRIQTKAGHGAGKPTTMVIEEVADRYAFLHKAMGLDN
jgi:prolyl oligopeptidase